MRHMPRNRSQVKPLHLHCTTCGASPGEACTSTWSRTGRELRFPHEGRRQEAVDLSRTLRELWAAARLACVGLVLALALVLPAVAGARAVEHPTTDPVTLALKLGEEYWGSAPCDGHVAIASAPAAVTVEQTPAYEQIAAAGGEAAMWTSWQTPAGSNLESEPPATYTVCTITINAKAWGPRREVDENFQEYCDAMTHEVGHLFGHGDAGQTNPESIEYPWVGWDAPNFDSVPQCRGITLYYGHEAFRDLSEAESLCERARDLAAERAHRSRWVSCERYSSTK